MAKDRITKTVHTHWPTLKADIESADDEPSANCRFQALTTRKLMVRSGFLQHLLDIEPSRGFLRTKTEFELLLKTPETGWSFGSGRKVGILLSRCLEEYDAADNDVESDGAFVTVMGMFPILRQLTMFYGLPYVSTQYPWPMITSSLGCYPMVQLNLDEIASATGNDIGSGLLQLWSGYDHRGVGGDEKPNPQIENGHYLRHIPASAVGEPALTTVPNLADTGYDLVEDWRAFDIGEIGWDGSRLGEMFTDDFYGLLEDYLISEPYPDSMISDLIMAMVRRDSNIGGTMLFGSPCFVQNENYAGWLQGGWHCLMQLSDHYFNVGDGGTGQIMYRKTSSGEFEYKYIWSCY